MSVRQIRAHAGIALDVTLRNKARISRIHTASMVLYALVSTTGFIDALTGFYAERPHGAVTIVVWLLVFLIRYTYEKMDMPVVRVQHIQLIEDWYRIQNIATEIMTTRMPRRYEKMCLCALRKDHEAAVLKTLDHKQWYLEEYPALTCL